MSDYPDLAEMHYRIIIPGSILLVRYTRTPIHAVILPQMVTKSTLSILKLASKTKNTTSIRRMVFLGR